MKELFTFVALVFGCSLAFSQSTREILYEQLQVQKQQLQLDRERFESEKIANSIKAINERIEKNKQSDKEYLDAKPKEAPPNPSNKHWSQKWP